MDVLWKYRGMDASCASVELGERIGEPYVSEKRNVFIEICIILCARLD